MTGTAPTRPLEPSELTIDGGFWGDYQRLNEEVIIQHCLHWVERIGWVGNFDAAALGGPFEHAGVEFVDSEVYKLLEAMAWELRRRPEAGLTAQYKELVARVAAAQEDDGYLHTAFGHPGQRPRYSDLEWGHELYCFGHLFQAAAAAIRAGIDSDLPRVAARLADHVHAEFGPDGRNAVCGHPEIELALMELHRAVGASTGSTGSTGKLLELAQRFVERRGHGTLGEIEFGAAYFQDDVPIREADTLRGHAVRALYLAAGAVDVAVELGDDELLDAVGRQWEHAVARRTYLTGGMGAHHQDEAFGDDYELPPDRAYAETCAGIGSVMLSWRLLLATGDQRHADLIERTLYNNVISSPRADGKAFFYVNTLHQRVAGTVPDEEHHSARALASLRAPWFEVSCCPTNVARTLANVGMYFASASDHALHIHQYADMTIRARLDSGSAVAVQVRTGYPYEQSVSVTLLEDLDAESSVSLRVPAWARGAGVLSDGLERVVASGETVVINGPRPAGSPFVLQLPMPPRVTQPDPRIDAVRGQVAVERGPFVLAVEDVDLPDGVTVNDIAIDPTGIRPVEGGGAAVPVQLSHVTDTAHTLPYDEEFVVDRSRLDDPSVATFRPYFQWANRGPSTMRVWTPALADQDAPKDPPTKGME